MTIVDDEVLSEFRAKGTCELCGRRVYPLDPHHCFLSRGCGGGTRLDVAENLVALCRVCHGKAHERTETADEIREIVAARHGLTVDEIYAWLWLVNRTDKRAALPPRPWKDAAA